MRAYFLLLAAFGLVACDRSEAPAPVYDTVEVAPRSIRVAVESSGIVEPLARVEVKSKASGEVLDLLVETGDYVEQGTLLVRIDPRTVRNRLDQAEAELKAAQSRLRISRSQMERAERLVGNGTLTQTDYEQAALELANAEAQVVTARVTVENARIAVDDTEIRAPVAGTVIAKPVEKGQVISSPTQDVGGGTLLMTMADLSAVQIRALIDETDIGKIRPGMLTRVTVAAFPNQPFTGEVVKIEPQAVVEQNVTMFAVLISISNPDGLLLPGMNAEVEISVAERDDALSVPVMALRTDRDIEATARILGVSAASIRDRLAQSLPEEGRRQPARRQGETGEEPGRGERADSPRSSYRYGGRFWVVVSVPGGGRRIEVVETGLTDLENVEIVAGLSEGETVLLLPSAHLFETQERLQNWINRRVGTVPGLGG